MSARIFAAVLAALASGAVGAALAGAPQGSAGMAGRMDANGDGLISKDEFVKFHEARFDGLKNKDGVIRVDDVALDCPMMGGAPAKGGKAARHPGMMGMMAGHGASGEETDHGSGGQDHAH